MFRELDRYPRRRLTWLHGPAGAGKTVLLASYLATRQRPVLWYGIDVTDRDVSGFFHYMALAAQQLVGRVLPVAKFRPGSRDALRAFTRRFFQTLFAELPAGSCCVFDDYQEAASEPAFNTVFRELIAVTPSEVRLFVASRSAPARVLSRHIASDALGVLGWNDLRFSSHEVQRFLRSAGVRALPPEGAQLAQQTQGWPVALSLLAKGATAERGRAASKPAARGRIQAASERVFDFLASEIFEELDTPARQLLLAVSLFPSFSLEQAKTVAGDLGVERLIEGLVRDSLLLESHGDGRFRLHDLFRAFLRKRMRQYLPEELHRSLSGRVALLLVNDDQFQAAAELFTGSSDWRGLLQAIEQSAPTLASRGQFATLRWAIALVPAPERASSAWLTYWESVACLAASSASAQALAERSYHAFEAAGDPAGTGLAWALVLQCIIRRGCDFRSIGSWLDRLDQLPVDALDSEVATQVALSELLAYCYWAPGSPRALAAARKAVASLRAYRRPDEQILMVCCMAMMVYGLVGEKQSAHELREIVRGYLASFARDPLVVLVGLQLDAMVLSWLHNDVAGAALAIRQALELGRLNGVELLDSNLRFQGAQFALGLGDMAGCRALLGPWRAQAAAGSPITRGPYAYASGWYAFERGDLNDAEHYLEQSLEDAERLSATVPRILSVAGICICAAARGDTDRAHALLRRLAEMERQVPVRALLVANALTRAYVSVSAGSPARAELELAIRLAASEGLAPCALFTQSVLKRLVIAALEAGIELEAARRLIGACAIQPGPEAALLPDWPWSIRIRVIGRFTVEVDGRELQFGRKLPRVPLMLLKLLAAHETPLPIERVIRALWPGYGGQQRRGTLDTAVYRLRRLLGSERAVEYRGKSLALSSALCWVDARAATALCQNIEALARRRVPALAHEAERSERLLFDLYRAPFAGEEELPQLARARERMLLHRQTALETLSRLWQKLGQPGRCEALLRVAGQQRERD